MCGVFFEGVGDWVGGGSGGTRSHCFNSGYHDLLKQRDLDVSIVDTMTY